MARKKKKDEKPSAPETKPSGPPPSDGAPASRRTFLKVAGAGALAAGAAGVWYVKTHPSGGTGEGDDAGTGDADGGSAMTPVARPEALLTFDEHEYDTLDAIAGVLVPADEDPGARETGAMIYVDRAMANPAFRTGARSMKVAVKAVDWQSEQAYAKKFVELGAPEQEAVIQAVYQGEADRGSFKGRTFMTLMMSLVLEGHLSDPAHGGNRDGAGWKLVAFTPMDPRPGHPMAPGGHHHHQAPVTPATGRPRRP